MPLVASTASPASTVLVSRSFQEVELLRGFWTRHQHHPNSDLDHFLLVCRTSPAVISPCVLSVWHGGECRAVLAGRLEQGGVRPHVGYLRLPRVQGRTLMFIHEGLIGAVSSREARLLADRLGGLLQEGVANLAVFNHVKEDSPLLGCMATQARHALGLANPRWSPHWELTLHSEPGFLVKEMKSKHRSWVRRKERELLEAYPGRLSWRWHTQAEDVGGVCRQMENVACRTYQRGLGAGFRDESAQRERLALFARRGQLRALVLAVDQQPAGFWLGLSYRGTFHSSATGFLPELNQYEVGTQMFLRLVDELVREGIGRFDFGLGDANYKQRFGDRSWRESTIRMFEPGRQGRFLRAYVGSCEALDAALRAVVQRVGVRERLKQAWRRRLAMGGSQAGNPVE